MITGIRMWNGNEKFMWTRFYHTTSLLLTHTLATHTAQLKLLIHVQHITRSHHEIRTEKDEVWSSAEIAKQHYRERNAHSTRK